MVNIRLSLATKKDKKQLLDYFKHYRVKEILERRVDCYTSHNFTVVAKNKDKIVGVLQWYVKEDPKIGIVEFEEIHVLEDYRGRGIGSSLIKFAIQSVKDFFKKLELNQEKYFFL